MYNNNKGITNDVYGKNPERKDLEQKIKGRKRSWFSRRNPTEQRNGVQNPDYMTIEEYNNYLSSCQRKGE